ncbi:FTR1 family iron permease [Candidatus Trichorickettsia mobilis]|uniref:FTR1 family iron permease n=1 Tax=Candidatus Trichorickettsia mobilis TaxID=1346319 RepID=UPI002930B191|nr:FTR1 family protein [Candidatus Trichorickettsia mobilis]
MFKIAVIIFRESLEIALILGILMAVTKKIENSRMHIIAGVMLGVVIASLFAFFTKTISLSFSGLGDEIVNSTIILVTVVMISCTIIWMQDFANKMKQDFETLSIAINNGTVSRFVLTSIVATTILREGVEIMLCVYSIASMEQVDMDDYLFGLALGSATGLSSGILIYWGLLKLAKKYLFKVSSVLLMFIAAGLASEAASILTSSGIIEIFSDELWDSNWLIDDRSVTGQMLKAVAGYTARPNGMQIIFYFSTLFSIGVLILLQQKLYAKAKTK